MRWKAFLTITLLATGSATLAQPMPGSGQPALENFLIGIMRNTFRLNGTCKLLLTPEGDQTSVCEPELINMVLPSGKSSFIVTIKNKGGISFGGKGSAPVGDIATLSVSTIILSGTDPSPAIVLKAQGQCTYTNPHAGPAKVDCTAKTKKGIYQLSYVSDGNWPPR